MINFVTYMVRSVIWVPKKITFFFVKICVNISSCFPLHPKFKTVFNVNIWKQQQIDLSRSHGLSLTNNSKFPDLRRRRRRWRCNSSRRNVVRFSA